MKVDFMIIGAQKSGTTTLFDILNSHPSLVGSAVKEPDFFSQNNWQDKITNYESLFDIQDGALYFEATTNYTFSPHIPNKNLIQDLYTYNPDLKFIYIVRRPLDRIVSGYMHGRQIGAINADINKAIKENSFFIDITRYYHQVTAYIEVFGKSSVMLIDFDDLVSNQTKVVNEVAKFIGVTSSFSNTNATHKNSSIGTLKPNYKYLRLVRIAKKLARRLPKFSHGFSKKIYQKMSFLSGDGFNEKPTLTESSKNYILEQLDEDTTQLEKLMGKKLEHWRD